MSANTKWNKQHSWSGANCASRSLCVFDALIDLAEKWDAETEAQSRLHDAVVAEAAFTSRRASKQRCSTIGGRIFFLPCALRKSASAKIRKGLGQHCVSKNLFFHFHSYRVCIVRRGCFLEDKFHIDCCTFLCKMTAIKLSGRMRNEQFSLPYFFFFKQTVHTNGRDNGWRSVMWRSFPGVRCQERCKHDFFYYGNLGFKLIALARDGAKLFFRGQSKVVVVYNYCLEGQFLVYFLRAASSSLHLR